MKRLHSTIRAAVLLAVVALLGCPTIKILSVTVEGAKKDRATLVINVEVANPDDDAGVNSSVLCLGLDQAWTVEAVRYQVPGEPMARRARPAPAVAAQADWTYLTSDSAWWVFRTADHAVPAGTHVYRVEVDVRYPKKTRGGLLSVVVGDPGPDAVAATFDLSLKPAGATPVETPPQVNPESQAVAASQATGDLGQAFAELGEGMGALGEGLAQGGDGGSDMAALGTLLGLGTGSAGFREPWLNEATVDGVIQLGAVTLALPPDWSVLGDQPTGPETALAVMPPGSPCILGLEIVPGLDETQALEVFEREVQTATDDLATAGTPATASEVQRVTPTGLQLVGQQLSYTDEFGPERLVLLRRVSGGTLVIGVTFGDEATVTTAETYLDMMMDAIAFP
jgi:hypothetical protein